MASSKLDYLKRYMSDVQEPREKRKKRKKVVNPKATAGIVVVDAEIEVHKSFKRGTFEDDPYRDNDPTIAEIFDDTIPQGMQDSKKWKSIATTDQEGRDSGRGYHEAVVVRRETPDSDFSPPRHIQPPQSSFTKHSKNSQSRHTSQRPTRSEDSDLSPDRDQSAVINRSSRRSPSDISPSRASTSRNRKLTKVSRRSSSRDLSPLRDAARRSKVRRASSRDSDLSPVRTASSSLREASSKPISTSNQLPKSTLSGMTAGLQSARTLREEADRRRRREEETFETMDVDISGRNAETVYRDRKTGKRRDMDAEAVIEEEKAARKKIHDDKFKKWGKGIVQGEKQLQNVNDAIHEASKPLTRYADDSDRDALLKAIDRDGDPMLEYVNKKKTKSQGEEGRPRYKGPPPPPNRFGIPPGYRWDGVDRSTGYEKNRFNRMSNKTAVSEEAYKWSTEDM